MSFTPAKLAFSKSARLDSIDFLRGVVMVVMALDHTRGFFSNAHVDVHDPTQASVALFFTRWVTHFCAPTFVFLAGMGAYLAGQKAPSRDALARFLFVRGLWLVILELTVVRFGFFFNFDYHFAIGQVIWAIGWSMVLLAFLVWLPPWMVGLIGVAIVAGHNALDGVAASEFGRLGWLWDLLKNMRGFELNDLLHRFPSATDWLGRHGFDTEQRIAFFNAYPILPWFGVMTAGYGFGTFMREESGRQRWICFIAGAVLIGGFIALRAERGYGDPRPWPKQSELVAKTTQNRQKADPDAEQVSENEARALSLMAFINCQKYPPSLLFALMTIGPALVVLSISGFLPGILKAPFITFGRVPLFFYILHFILIHGFAIWLATRKYGSASWLFENPGGPESNPPPGYGYGLPTVYLFWVLVVVTLYLPCLGFSWLKRRYPGGVLSYL
jgi:uncharacterized membrane protein